MPSAVVEAGPLGRGGYRGVFIPLDEFGVVPFSGGGAVKNGRAQTIAGAGAAPLSMIDRTGGALAHPSVINADGRSFTVTRTTGTSVPVADLASKRPSLVEILLRLP